MGRHGEEFSGQSKLIKTRDFPFILMPSTLKALDTNFSVCAFVHHEKIQDAKFCKNLHKAFGTTNLNDSKKINDEADEDEEADPSKKYFVSPKFGSDRQFIIVHFAGKVRFLFTKDLRGFFPL